MILWMFLMLLASHFLGDFVLQTHWMASNKSKSSAALIAHVLTYTAVLFGASLIIFPWPTPAKLGLLFAFVGLNTVLHLATDYCTSRWTSRLFGAWMRDMQQTKHIQDFFVVIGLDQLIHQVTLATTMWFFFFYLGGMP